MATTASYTVTGMSCGHCENAVREEVSQIPGVTDIDVSAQTGDLSITSEQTIDDTAVLAAVDEAGYTATRN